MRKGRNSLFKTHILHGEVRTENHLFCIAQTKPISRSKIYLDFLQEECSGTRDACKCDKPPDALMSVKINECTSNHHQNFGGV